MPEPRIVATAGHIDHGKSTLVEALTGTNPDRLPEERKRGMTIELGFAHLDLPDRQAAGDSWHVGLVDVPGHADFVRNMVAGIGSIDAALLVVAADDGWMPQTEEHFQILLHLGVTHGVVALTKSDLAPPECAVGEQIRKQLEGTPWSGAPVVPVCALSGEGLDALRDALRQVMRETPAPEDGGKPRLFVDRVFSPRGAGTVVTGTLAGGSLRVGEAVIIQPAGLRGRVRGLQCHNKPVETARPGSRTAVQISGVDAAHEAGGAGVWRGHVLEGGLLLSLAASEVVHVSLERFSRERNPGEAPPVKHGQRVWCHHGSAGYAARLYFVDRRTLGSGESALAELRFNAPVAVHEGDRFILRDFSRRHTLAGGLILDRSAKARSWKKKAFLDSLTARAAHPQDAAAWIRALLDRDGWLQPEGLLVRSRFPAAAIPGLLENLDAVRHPGWIISPGRWNAVVESGAALVRKFHQAKPLEAGLSVADCRAGMAAVLPDPALADAAIAELERRGFVRTQHLIRAGDFKPALPPEVRRACLALRGVLFADKANPPGTASYVRSPEEKAALRSMLQSGELFMLDADTAMLTAGYEELKQRILAALHAAGRATMATLRDATGSTRRILVPVCERMDRERLTVRDGDFRRAVAIPPRPGPVS